MGNHFWNGRRVLITGHTGFKGTWLALCLHRLGADVFGYSLKPETQPNLFSLVNLDQLIHSEIGDIRDLDKLRSTIDTTQPEIIFHLAAQALVRDSYKHPLETFDTNVMGTANLLQCATNSDKVKTVVVVTSDKCYENKEWHWGYRENEALGGYDPYSASKACTELVAAAWRQSFALNTDPLFSTQIATARAGNVVGGGDWSEDRLVPDILRNLTSKQALTLRNPNAIRPWQHVLEPLAGYLLLAERLHTEPQIYAEAWNFGPYESDAKPVSWIVERLSMALGVTPEWQTDSSNQPHEAHYLKLDCSKARTLLGWQPRWSLDQCIMEIADWHNAYEEGQDMRQYSLESIERYDSQLPQ